MESRPVITCRRCPERAAARGLCRRHYHQVRGQAMGRGHWDGRVDATGTSRRLRALVALGYTNAQLRNKLAMSSATVHYLLERRQPTVNAATAARVRELYDQISMTPGSCDKARARAAARGWAPPLAWDEDALDDPTVDPPLPPLPRKRTPRLPWPERYTELRELGYNDLEITAKFGISARGLIRQLLRYQIQPSPQLVTEAHRERRVKVS